MDHLLEKMHEVKPSANNCNCRRNGKEFILEKLKNGVSIDEILQLCENPINDSRKRKRVFWTEAEDEVLKTGCNEEKTWSEISEDLISVGFSRTNIQVKDRARTLDLKRCKRSLDEEQE